MKKSVARWWKNGILPSEKLLAPIQNGSPLSRSQSSLSWSLQIAHLTLSKLSLSILSNNPSHSKKKNPLPISSKKWHPSLWKTPCINPKWQPLALKNFSYWPSKWHSLTLSKSLSHPKNDSLVIPQKTQQQPGDLLKKSFNRRPLHATKSPIFQKYPLYRSFQKWHPLTLKPSSNATCQSLNGAVGPLESSQVIAWSLLDDSKLSMMQKSLLLIPSKNHLTRPLTLFSFISLKLYQTPLSQSIRDFSN